MVDVFGVGNSALNIIPNPVWYLIGIAVLYVEAFGGKLWDITIEPNFISNLITPVFQVFLGEGFILTGFQLLGLYIVILLSILAVRLS